MKKSREAYLWYSEADSVPSMCLMLHLGTIWDEEMTSYVYFEYSNDFCWVIPSYNKCGCKRQVPQIQSVFWSKHSCPDWCIWTLTAKTLEEMISLLFAPWVREIKQRQLFEYTRIYAHSITQKRMNTHESNWKPSDTLCAHNFAPRAKHPFLV
jgi:hypothetical protein